MSPRAAALRVVKDDVPVSRGDESLTVEAMGQWREGQRRCRARRRHNWLPYTVWEHATYYEVVERCGSCYNRRSADFAKTGRKINKWTPIYRDNYLLPKGAMRIGDDLHDELVLGDILSRKIIEALDEEDD